MTPTVTTPVLAPDDQSRETWGKKVDFLLSVIGFAVDLGNVWRFPYICYKNGGGAFLIPYMIMLIFGGLPLFYMELALGQFQRCGCITVWRRICPLFKGIGFGICIIASYVAIYYNTMIAWSVYFLVSSFTSRVPWADCGHPWNTENCTNNITDTSNTSKSPAEEFFERNMLELHRSEGLGDLGQVKWSIALCLLAVFVIVYFSLWKGIKSSGKAVWVTATLPYMVLLILLIRGITLEGSLKGIIYYLNPRWEMLSHPGVWIDAAAQIFFSLGPGFGVLLALSSYNKFHNNCYRFLAGFVVFSVLGYMSVRQNKDIDKVAQRGVGLVFVVYPEAIATLGGSSFWSIIFFLMLITLGLDSTFGGLEALITGVCDEWPNTIGKRREMFVAGLIVYCFLGALATTTYGGIFLVNLLDNHGAPISILFICFLECIAVNWFYGVEKFSSDLESMLGFRPGIFWRICWVYISPAFLICLFVLSIVFYEPFMVNGIPLSNWGIGVGWLITVSSILPIFIYAIYRFTITKGQPKERLCGMLQPEEYPKLKQEMPNQPVYL